jgi:hypothetical protein
MVFAFSIWDLSLWVAGSSILMLIASEFISPYYGRMNTIIDQKKLRWFAVGFGITFFVFTIAKAISLQSS